MNGVHRIARILVPVGGGWTRDRLLENGQAYLRNVARAAKAGSAGGRPGASPPPSQRRTP